MAGGADNITITVDVNGSRVSGGIQGVVNELSKIASSAGAMHAGMQSQNNLTAVTWGNMGQAILGNMGTLGSWIFTASNAFNLINDGIGFVGGIANAFTSAAQMVLSFAESLGQIAWDGIQQGVDLLNQLSGALGAVTSTMQTAFAESAFQLNETTEKNFANWMFLWGGPQKGGGNVAQQLVQWSKQASLKIPYTRQDLMDAITTLSAMPGQTPAQIEHDLTLLSDVASTQGRPGLTLSWAAMAAMRGGQGYSRMLLMDLKISKDELAKFGYNEKDGSTFFPALQKYAAWKGELGASATISTQTFWGAQTSFTDRIQNFLLSAGGWNDKATTIMGDVRKGSLFGVLKDDLIGISQWMDTNGPTLDKLASIADSLFGGVATSAGSVFSGLFDNLSKSNLATDFFTGVTSFGTWLNSPTTQHNLTEFGNLIGNIVGPGLRDMGTSAENFWRAFTGSGVGQDVLAMLQNLGEWLASPSTQGGLKQLGEALGKLGGGISVTTINTVTNLLSGIGNSGAVQTLQSNLQGLGNWFADPQHQAMVQGFAYLLGTYLGDAVTNLTTDMKWLIDALGAFVTLGADLASGDLAKFGVDLAFVQQTLAKDTQQAQLAAGKWAYDIVAPLLGGAPGTPGHPLAGGQWPAWLTGNQGNPNAPKYVSPKHLESAGQSIADALAAAVHGHGGSQSGQVAGQQYATSYIAAAQQVFQQKSGGGGALVQTLTNGINQELQRSGNTLTQTLAHFIDTRTRQIISEMLAGYDLTSNRTGRQVGGFRNGPALGF